MSEGKPCVEIPFAVGSQVWWVGPQYREERITCPECSGERTITLTLGNGSPHVLDCAWCSRGCNPPSGTIARTVCGYEPIEVILKRVMFSGEEPYYVVDAGRGSTAQPEDLFVSYAECVAACETKRAKFQDDHDKRELAQLLSKRRDLAWSVSYWRNERKKRLDELARIEATLDASKRRQGLAQVREQAE